MHVCPSSKHLNQMVSAVLCTLCISINIVDAKSLSTEALIDVEKAAVEARKKINSGHFIVSVSYNTFLRDPSYTKLKRHYQIFLNGNDERVDLGQYQSGELVWDNTVILTKDTFIRAPLYDDSIVQVFGPKTRPLATLETPDPRLLGFVPWFFASINQFGLEEYLLRTDRSSVSARRCEHEGEPVVEVSYQFNLHGAKAFNEYRLAVNKGYQPTYVSTSWGNGAERTFYSVANTLTYHKNIDLWFPGKVVLRSKTGDTLTVEEIDTVELAELNKKINDATFSLAELRLEPGRLVANDGKLMWWTGERLVRKRTGEDKYYPIASKNKSKNALASSNEKTSVSRVSRGWLEWFLLANAILLAILSVSMLVIRRKRRRSS